MTQVSSPLRMSWATLLKWQPRIAAACSYVSPSGMGRWFPCPVT